VEQQLQNRCFEAQPKEQLMETKDIHILKLRCVEVALAGTCFAIVNLANK
jgi:hypothetical protein